MSEQKSTFSGGLLSSFGLMTDQESKSIAKREADAKQKILGELRNTRLAREYNRSRTLTLSSPSWVEAEAENAFDERLLEFAQKRGLLFYPSETWRTRALELAAKEHPRLNPAKRKKGRPKKVEIYGILSANVTLTDEELDWARAVDRILSHQAEIGEKPNQKEAIRFILAYTKIDAVGSSTFEANVKKYEKVLASARKKKRQEPLRPGRKSNTANK